jgi:hypothetical protein
MDECAYQVGDRVLAPAFVGRPNLFPGTVTEKRDYQTPPSLGGESETIPKVRVRFDDEQYDKPWLDCRAVKPITEEAEA